MIPCFRWQSLAIFSKKMGHHHGHHTYNSMHADGADFRFAKIDLHHARCIVCHDRSCEDHDVPVK